MLKSKVELETLFQKGQIVKAFPLIAKYLFVKLKDDQTSPSEHSDQNIRIAISVSKRRFKSAVDRNKIKRKIKEAYRLNQFEFKVSDSSSLQVLFIFTGKEIYEYRIIEKSILKIIKKINSALS